MTHEAFICHSSKDVSFADKICTTIESEGRQCWIAPRNILAGQIWMEAIFYAIDSSPLVVFIASANSYTSGHVSRELENAATNNTIIIPFRIDYAPIPKWITYLIGNRQWLDAQEPPLEKHLKQLADTVKVLLEEKGKVRGSDGDGQRVLRCPNPKCGVELRPDAKFCNKCGTPVIANMEIKEAWEKAKKEAEEAQKKTEKEEEATKTKEAADKAKREEEEARKAKEAADKTKREEEEARKAKEDEEKAKKKIKDPEAITPVLVCRSCRNELRSDAIFCNKCGTPVS